MIAGWLIIVMALIQLGISIDLFRTKQYGLGITFFAYSVSSIGLWMAAKT